MIWRERLTDEFLDKVYGAAAIIEPMNLPATITPDMAEAMRAVLLTALEGAEPPEPPQCKAEKRVGDLGTAVCTRDQGHDGPHVSCGVAWEDAHAEPAAAREGAEEPTQTKCGPCHSDGVDTPAEVCGWHYQQALKRLMEAEDEMADELGIIRPLAEPAGAEPERPQPTCATCRHFHWREPTGPPFKFADGHRGECAKLPMGVTYDFGCKWHEPVAHAQTPERGAS